MIRLYILKDTYDKAIFSFFVPQINGLEQTKPINNIILPTKHKNVLIENPDSIWFKLYIISSKFYYVYIKNKKYVRYNKNIKRIILNI